MTQRDLILFEMGQLSQAERVRFLSKLRQELHGLLKRPISDFDLLLATDDLLRAALRHAVTPPKPAPGEPK